MISSTVTFRANPANNLDSPPLTYFFTLEKKWDVATLATESDPAGWETEPRLKVTMLSKDDIEARKKVRDGLNSVFRV